MSNPKTPTEPKTEADRIQEAIQIGINYGGYDGGHHKMWVIDQMIRALTGCPMEKQSAKDCNGKIYHYETMGESEEYKELIRQRCDGEDGPNTYEWDIGIPP